MLCGLFNKGRNVNVRAAGLLPAELETLKNLYNVHAPRQEPRPPACIYVLVCIMASGLLQAL
jgi:hypothetical protein